MTTKAEAIQRIEQLARNNNLVLPGAASSSGDDERGLDSIGRLELIVAIEQEFEVSLLDEEVDAESRFRDLDAIAQLVLDKLAS
ncbi:MAG: phosphopantetheine-binding protein [Gammaproteobacteria bacterium]